MESVVFQTSGILDLRAITIFGCSAKPRTSSPIGYFGTGLKYALAVLAREGCTVTIYRGLDKPLELKVNNTSFRDTTLSSLILGEQELPFTTDLGKNWEVWQALRELESNTRDEGGSSYILVGDLVPEAGITKIRVSRGDFVEVYEAINSIFLENNMQNISESSDVEIYEAPSEHLYYKGIRVYTFNKPAMFTYNIMQGVELTENRTISHWFYVERVIIRALAGLTNPELIARILEAEDNLESSIDFNDTFNQAKPTEVFKETAVKHSNKSHSAVDLIHRLEREEKEAELEEAKKSPEELIDDLVDNILQTLCEGYIEEPAGRGCGYGISTGGGVAVQKLIEDFIKDYNN
jgi:hypothetical protein